MMRLLLVVVIFVISSCSTMQSSFMPVGNSYPAKAVNCQIEILKREDIQKPFEKIATVQAHLESTFFRRPGFENAAPQLKKQACLAGADAIIDVSGKSSFYIEVGTYDVKATAIRYLK